MGLDRVQLRTTSYNDGRKAGRVYQGKVREVGVRQVSSINRIIRDHVQACCSEFGMKALLWNRNP